MLLCPWRPVRRDSAYSWIVAFAAFTSILFSIGLSFGSVGVMTEAFGEFYNASKSEVLPWVGSSRLSFIFLTGVASSSLVNRFGARTVQLVGSAVAALGIGLSALSTELWHLLLAYGCLAGIGMSFIFTASSVVVEGYFCRFLHVVLPLTQLGDTVGYSVFPVSTRSLLDTIGVQNTLYFFCGVCGVPALCALLYADPPSPPAQDTEAQCSPASAATATPADSDRRTSIATTGPGATDKPNGHNRSKEDVNLRCRQEASLHGVANGRSYSRSDHVTLLRMRAFEDELPSSRSASPDECGGITAARSSTDCCLVLAPNGVNVAEKAVSSQSAAMADATNTQAALVGGYADEAIANGSATYRSGCSSGDRVEASAMESGAVISLSLPAETSARESSLNTDLRNLLTSGDAWIVFANTLLWPYTASAIIVLLYSYIVRAGVIDKEQAALGVTIIGLANVAGNVTTILLGLRPYNHALFYTVSCGALGAGAMIYVVADHSVGGYYALCAFNGFWLGVILGLVVSIMYEYSGRASFTSMFGFSTFATGLGDLAGGGVTGIIQNKIGDDVGFYVSGAFSILACAVMVPLAVRRYRRPASVEPS